MRDILAHCAELAHLQAEDAYKLEQDISDMLAMADRLSAFDEPQAEYGDEMQLSDFRDDASGALSGADAVLSGPLGRGRCPCVPRIKGV